MAQLKQSWQYWHSCIAESLLKPLIKMWAPGRTKKTFSRGRDEFCAMRSMHHGKWSHGILCPREQNDGQTWLNTLPAENPGFPRLGGQTNGVGANLLCGQNLPKTA